MVGMTPRAYENDYCVQGLHILAHMIARSLLARQLHTKREQQIGKPISLSWRRKMTKETLTIQLKNGEGGPEKHEND